MDELARILDRWSQRRPRPRRRPPGKRTEKKESVSMYAMVSIDNNAHLLDVYRKLYFHRNVLYCDAIRGDYDLALLLQAPTFDEIDELVEKEIKAIRGVAEVSLLPVGTPMFGDNVVNIIGSVDRALGRDEGESEPSQTGRQRISSYVMLEVEKEKMEAIYPTLYFNNQVVNCDYTEGRFNIVLLIRGTSFAEIEQPPSFLQDPGRGAEDQGVSDHHPLRGMIEANVALKRPSGGTASPEGRTRRPPS